jgi:DnaJ-class molecular chaperone
MKMHRRDCRQFSVPRRQPIDMQRGNAMSLFGLIFDLLRSPGYPRRARRDQRRWSTQIRNAISPINSYGTCFSCNGRGKKSLSCGGCGGSGIFTGSCNSCKGTGIFKIPAKPCKACEGKSIHVRSTCRRCSGTGIFRPAIDLPCRRCQGKGTFTQTCRRCSGSGCWDATCLKCGGSGWHRF